MKMGVIPFSTARGEPLVIEVKHGAPVSLGAQARCHRSAGTSC